MILESFEQEIMKHAIALNDRAFDTSLSSSPPRYSLVCSTIIIFNENILLILFSLAAFSYSSYRGTKLVYSLIYRYRATPLYRKLEKHVQAIPANADMTHGVTEGDIVHLFRGTMSEQEFSNHVMPHLESYRAKGHKIKKFEDIVDGKRVIKWQYTF